MSTAQNNKHILIIDDSASIRNYIGLLLKGENYSVTEAENGEEGIKIFREGIFDLIITDVFMPILGGLEVVVKLRAEFPDVKIIVLSDGGKDNFTDDLKISEALGAVCFLSKSRVKEELLPIIKNTLTLEE